MTRIGGDVAVLAAPTWQDARRGAFATWIYISLGLPLCIAVWMAVSSWVASPQSMAFFPGLGMAAVIAFVAFLVITTISGVVILLVGIAAGMLLSKVLSRVTKWQSHLVAYFALGVLAYGVVLLTVRLLDPREYGFFVYFFLLGPVTPLLIGACVAAGWATAWRRAVRRAAAPPSDTGIRASLVAD